MGKRPDSLRPVDVFNMILGSLMLAYALVAFNAPNDIVPAGVTGIATIAYSVFGLPIGVTLLVMNIILIFLQAKILGTKSAGKTLFISIITSVAIDVMMQYSSKLAIVMTDPLMACLFGSLVAGTGIALTFKAGGNTGGMDIVSQIMQFKFKVPISDTLLFSNALVTVLAGFSFGMEKALYSIIYVFLSSRVIDAALDGMSVFRTVFIVTKEADVIGWSIIEDLRRGVTCLDGTGIYSGKPVNMLLTAIKRGELHLLRQIVYRYDPKAFVIVGDARQVLGYGFSKLEDEVRFASGDFEDMAKDVKKVAEVSLAKSMDDGEKIVEQLVDKIDERLDEKLEEKLQERLEEKLEEKIADKIEEMAEDDKLS